jgi:nucleotide-binding universal stress UspA family protein
MGFHRPVIGATFLGGTVHKVLSTAPADAGIFVHRNFTAAQRILVPYLGSTHDRLAMELARRIAQNADAKIVVLHVVPPKRGSTEETMGAKKEVDRVFEEPGQASPVTFRVMEDPSPVTAVLREAKDADLVIIGVAEQWGLESQLFGWRPQRIAQECPTSLLIVRRFAEPKIAPAGSSAPIEPAPA